jgi:hypothetical protein
MQLAFPFDVDEDGVCTYLAMLPTAAEARQMAEEREAA